MRWMAADAAAEADALGGAAEAAALALAEALGGAAGAGTAALALATAPASLDGSSWTMGRGAGVEAQSSPAVRKSAAPRAGSQSGVRGSASSGDVACTGSVMACRAGLTTNAPVVSSGAAGRPKRAIMKGVKTMMRLSLAATLLLATSTPLSSSAAPLTPLPGTAPQPAQAPNPTQSVVYAGQQRISRGVTTVERDGRVLAVGTVLFNFGGRILTALSPLGASDLADVRYSDGSVVHARVGHRDKAWDLAMLVPLSGHWEDGLPQSLVQPSPTDLKSLVATRPGRPMVVPAHLRGTLDVRAQGGDDLTGALDVDMQTSPPSVGAPLLDADGGVVGVFVHACRATLPPTPAPGAPAAAPQAAPPCAALIVGAPVAAIRNFVAHTPATAITPSPWLGIVGSTETGATKGVRVMAVAPDGPAEKGGLKGSDDRAQSDLIVAVDAVPIDTQEKLGEIIGKHAIGDKVKLLVLGADGKFREAVIVLRPAP
jgi:serine protease Do